MKPVQRLAVVLFLFISVNACVSVELNKSQPVSRNENTKFNEPAKPFEELKSNDLDHAWRHPKNGNSISYISECSSAIDPSLENIHSGVIKGVMNPEVIVKGKLNYNGREAMRSVVSGDVDGVTSKVDFLIFKKNGCTFVLTYVALTSTFAQNSADFQNFIDSFKAP